MALNFGFFIETEEQRQLMDVIDPLAKVFAQRAKAHDVQGSFPYENFEDLKKAGLLTLTIPKKYGGEEISLYTFLLLMERIGRADASTALGLGWHLGIIKNLYHTSAWKEAGC